MAGTTPLQQAALLVPLAYLVGSIPFGLMVGKLKGVDPRTAGSGNIGASNVGRLLGRKFFAVVFLLDLLKGLLPMLLAGRVLQGAGCPAVMTSPIVVRLEGDGSGSMPLGSTGYVHAFLDGDQLDVTFSVEGDRRDLVCRGEVVRSSCTAALLASDSN